MEDRMMKFYSKESNMLALHAMHGHFATSHSHINYYVDVTSIKTRVAAMPFSFSSLTALFLKLL